MGVKPLPFTLFFERLFLESYSGLGLKEKKAIDRAVQILAQNPRHPSLQVHKAKSISREISYWRNQCFYRLCHKNPSNYL